MGCKSYFRVALKPFTLNSFPFVRVVLKEFYRAKMRRPKPGFTVYMRVVRRRGTWWVCPRAIDGTARAVLCLIYVPAHDLTLAHLCRYFAIGWRHYVTLCIYYSLYTCLKVLQYYCTSYIQFLQAGYIINRSSWW